MAVPWDIPKRCIRTAQKTRSVWIFPRQGFSRYHCDGVSLGCPQLMHSYSTDNTLGRRFRWAIGSNRIQKRGFPRIVWMGLVWAPTPLPPPPGRRVITLRFLDTECLTSWILKATVFSGGGVPPAGTFLSYLALFYDVPSCRKRRGRTRGQKKIWLEDLDYIYTYNKYWNIVGCANRSTVQRISDVLEEGTEYWLEYWVLTACTDFT